MEPERQLASMNQTFWNEYNDFKNILGYFSKATIWFSTKDANVPAYIWHQNYSLPYSNRLGKLACLVTLKPLSIGQMEWNWKAIKMNKFGKRGHLSP
jgi:hypothetical protein